MIITINKPTKEATEFAHAYLNEVRDERPNTNEFLRPSKLIGLENMNPLANGMLDDKAYDIEMNIFNWLHYFILKRYLKRIRETNQQFSSIISSELGLSRDKYNTLFGTSSKPKPQGGKKRSVRRSRRRRCAHRTHRRRA